MGLLNMNNVIKDFFEFYDLNERKKQRQFIAGQSGDLPVSIGEEAEALEANSKESIIEGYWNIKFEEVCDIKNLYLNNKNFFKENKEDFKKMLYKKVKDTLSKFDEYIKSLEDLKIPTLEDLKNAFNSYNAFYEDMRMYKEFRLDENVFYKLFPFCDKNSIERIESTCRAIFYSSFTPSCSSCREINKTVWFYLLILYFENNNRWLSSLPREVVVNKFKENFNINIIHNGYIFSIPDKEKKNFSDKINGMNISEERMEI